MDSFARNFIISALFYFGLTALLGLASALQLFGSYNLHYAHIHLGLAGWMSMMIFGVGYHVLPRFTGGHLYSRKLGSFHWFLANISLIGMVVLYPLKSMSSTLNTLFIISVVLQTISILIFILNIAPCFMGPKIGAGCLSNVKTPPK